MFKKIVVAVDDSPQASWAVDLAAQMAAEVGAHVTLLHVLDTPLGYVPDFGFTEVHVITELRSGAEEILDRALRRIPGSIAPRKVVREGVAATEIVAYATEWGADLIVLGTHGRGRLAHLLLGSCAEAVLRHAPCPVMAVRQQVVREPMETPSTAQI